MAGWRPVTVGTLITPIMSYNPERSSALIFNNGGAVLTVSQDPSDVAANGIPIDPTAAIEILSEDGDEPWLALFGVSTLGNLDIRVVEGFGELVAPRRMEAE